MADQSIFGENQNSSTQTQQPNSNGQPSQNEQLATLLASVKNENGEQKYRTVEDALKALQHSQTYIPELKNSLTQTQAQLQEAQAQAAKITELEKALDALTQNNRSQEITPQGLSEEQIADLVTRTLSKSQQQAVAKENHTKVVSIMAAQFGDKAEALFYGKAQELGMSKEEINALAAKAPQAALKLLGVDAAANTNKGVPSTFNSAAFQPSPESTIKANKQSVLMGASSDEVINESRASRKMVEELHAAGLTTYDLSDPKVYKKYFS